MPAASSPSITAIRLRACTPSSSSSTARSTWMSGGASAGRGSRRWRLILPRWRKRSPPCRSAISAHSRLPLNKRRHHRRDALGFARKLSSNIRTIFFTGNKAPLTIRGRLWLRPAISGRLRSILGFRFNRSSRLEPMFPVRNLEPRASPIAHHTSLGGQVETVFRKVLVGRVWGNRNRVRIDCRRHRARHHRRRQRARHHPQHEVHHINNVAQVSRSATVGSQALRRALASQEKKGRLINQAAQV